MQTPKRALEWTYRAPLLVEEILNSRPDIVCLQEVNHYGELVHHVHRVLTAQTTCSWPRHRLGDLEILPLLPVLKYSCY